MKLQVKILFWLAAFLVLTPVVARAQDAPAPPPAATDVLRNPAQRQALKDELAQLPPAERQAKMAQLRQQAQARRAAALAARQQKFQAKWAKATPAQRQKFCSNVTTRCATKGANNEACNFAKSTCSGQ